MVKALTAKAACWINLRREVFMLTEHREIMFLVNSAGKSALTDVIGNAINFCSRATSVGADLIFEGPFKFFVAVDIFAGIGIVRVNVGRY